MSNRADLKVGFQCNNRCLFCVQGDKRLRFAQKSLKELEGKLEQARKRGMRSLVLTGGEPTLHPGILALVAHARKLGYTTIQIQTNGRLFAYTKTCREFIKAGATEFSPALHGPRAEVHDFLTSSPGSFLQTVAGIKNLRRLGQLVITNTVVTRPNYRQLPDTARLLGSLGVQQAQFAFVHMKGEAWRNRSWLAPRLELARPYLLEALRAGRNCAMRMLTEAVPPCHLPGCEDRAAEWIIPDTVVFDAEADIDFTRYRKTEGKSLGPRCAKCRWAKRCEGPWREYPDMFGWEEFAPV